MGYPCWFFCGLSTKTRCWPLLVGIRNPILQSIDHGHTPVGVVVILQNMQSRGPRKSERPIPPPSIIPLASGIVSFIQMSVLWTFFPWLQILLSWNPISFFFSSHREYCVNARIQSFFSSPFLSTHCTTHWAPPIKHCWQAIQHGRSEKKRERERNNLIADRQPIPLLFLFIKTVMQTTPNGSPLGTNRLAFLILWLEKGLHYIMWYRKLRQVQETCFIRLFIG